MLAAGGVLRLWWCERGRVDPEVAEFLNRPSAIQRFRAQGSGPRAPSVEDSPLVAQAKALELYLDPPKRPEKPTLVVSMVSFAPPAPPVRPAAPSARFKLCATSYYPNEPGRSMALILESGSGEGTERWVKEGAQLGHFVIHEIRKGMIVYRDGDQLRDTAVEHEASVPGIVRDARPGSRQVSTAVGDAAAATLSARAGPNSMELSGGN